MASRDPGRLRDYIALITKSRGGVEGALHELKKAQAPPGDPTEGAFGAELGADAPSRDRARDAVLAITAGREPTVDDYAVAEAIIFADLRPAVDVVGGRFTITHPLWTHLVDDAGTRRRLEATMPSIGRIELPGHPRLPYGGTGFVVGDDLLMTNRHVAELFASGLGDRRLAFKAGARAGIDFLRERGSPNCRVVVVGNVVMMHPFWDMALLRVEGLPREHEALRLSLTDARDLAGRQIAVVGYPAFDARNPAEVQDKIFRGEYGVKRLQPGELQGGFTTASFGKAVPAATHDCSTLGGNSGSAVIDVETGEVLALHFGGRYQERNYCVPTFALSLDRRVVDAGVRFAGTPRGGPNDWGDWWHGADALERASDAPRAAAAAADAAPQRDAPATAAVVGTTVAAVASGVEIEIPLRISVTLGAPTLALPAPVAGAGPASRAEAPADEERLVEPQHDTNYGSRPGYDPAFLDPEGRSPSLAVPMPEAADPGVLAIWGADQKVLRYQNFSIAMHAARRLALVCASNVTREAALRLPEPGRDYGRDGLGGLGKNDQERWFRDGRLDQRYQLPDVFFTRDGGAFDKGHLVRREDVAWGKTYEALRRANGDTFHVTNCSPQVAGFNRSNLGEANWGDLENVVLADAASERLCVLTGPILDPGDQVFAGRAEGGAVLRARIPSRFWKVIVARTDAGLAAFGFILEQDLADTELEFAVPPEFEPALTPLPEIALAAGILFAPALLEADQFATARADEVAARGGVRRRRRRRDTEGPNSTEGARPMGDDANLTITEDELEQARAEREGMEMLAEAVDATEETAQPGGPASSTPISETAFDLIVEFEVSSQQVYTRKYRSTIWPGGASGVTVGIGYDLGYATHAQLEADFGDVLPTAMMAALRTALGVTGAPARRLAIDLSGSVDVPWDAAIRVHRNRVVPRWVGLVERSLQNTGQIKPDCLGSLISLTYNRGASFAKAGDRYAEMRSIKAHMTAGEFSKVPGDIRAMKRIWPDVPGLQKRREREARLFEKGLGTA